METALDSIYTLDVLENSTGIWQICQNWANDTIGRIIITLAYGLSRAFSIVTYCSNWSGVTCYNM